MSELIYIRISRGSSKVTDDEVIQSFSELGIKSLTVFDTTKNTWPVIKAMIVKPKVAKEINYEA